MVEKMAEKIVENEAEKTPQKIAKNEDEKTTEEILQQIKENEDFERLFNTNLSKKIFFTLWEYSKIRPATTLTLFTKLLKSKWKNNENIDSIRYNIIQKIQPADYVKRLVKLKKKGYSFTFRKPAFYEQQYNKNKTFLDKFIEKHKK